MPTTPTRQQRTNATATAMEIIAGTLVTPDKPVQIPTKDEAGHLIYALASYAGTILMHATDEDTTTEDLASSLRSAADLIRRT